MVHIHKIEKKATSAQLKEMQAALGTYIKLAVDIKKEILAGGGILHADCEAILLDNSSMQEDIWGADWLPGSKEVRFEALINIRPRQGNRSLTIQDENIRDRIEKIVRAKLGCEKS